MGPADLQRRQRHLLVAANTHPDHDTIAVFRRTNQAVFEAAFLQVLLLAREAGLLRVGTVSIDGTKIDANASKIRSVRYDRAKELRARLAADIAALTAQAEAADACAVDPQALPAEIARREALKAKLAAACTRLEAEAREQAAAERPACDAKKGWDAKKGRRGATPRPPPEPRTQSQMMEPSRIAMKAKLETDDVKATYKKRKETVEPVFGIIKSAMGFTRFRLQ